MKQGDIEILKRLEDVEKRSEKEFPLGWSWQEAKVWPAILNRLIMEGCIEVVFRSNSYTGYRMTDKGKFLVKVEGIKEEKEAMAEPFRLPQDLFQDILGHQEVKRLLQAAMLTPRPVHVLLTGPPALAKSLFLWELERVAGPKAVWILGSASSRAGLLEAILERKPWLILIDEMDKLDPRDQSALLSVMEGGRITRTKVGKMADETTEVRVVAAANRLNVFSPELISRFGIRNIHPYTPEEFKEVVIGVLQRREGVTAEMAEEIALRLEGRTQDMRDAIRVCRISLVIGVDEAVRLLLPLDSRATGERGGKDSSGLVPVSRRQ